MKGKRICSVIPTLLLMLVMLIGCSQNKQNVSNDGYADDQKQNQLNQEEINNEQPNNKIRKIESIKKVGDIEISNIKIELIAKGKCKFTADVKNISDKNLPSKNIKIKVLDKNGNVEKTFGGIITELIKSEENSFETYVWSDITDAYDIEFVESDSIEMREE